jgi:predicted TIM-barrel fold metal-dependent hydrolase
MVAPARRRGLRRGYHAGVIAGEKKRIRAAAPDANPRVPRIALPALACDCHAHVFEPEERYPLIGAALYTLPERAGAAEYRRMLDALGVQRGVLVQPSAYGTDNRAMLDALAADKKRLRGVAVVPFEVDPRTLEQLHAQGVRGVRCNIVDLKSGAGRLPREELRALAQRVKPFGWHVELLLHVDEFPHLDRELADFPVDVSFGHLGYAPAASGTQSAGLRALLRLARDGKAWVKLTGPYRLTGQELPYPDVDPFAQALVEAAPNRLLWGSDWPHVMVKSAMPDDGALLDLLGDWIPDAALRRRVLVDNPAALYDF